MWSAGWCTTSTLRVNSGLTFGALVGWNAGSPVRAPCQRRHGQQHSDSDIGGNLYTVYGMDYRVPFSLYPIESLKDFRSL